MTPPAITSESDARLQRWTHRVGRGLVYLSVAYVALSTADVEIGSIPLKLFVVLPALALWAVHARIWRRWREFAFARSVLVVAVLVPVVWLGVAAWLHHDRDPAQHATLRYAIQEASRFVYLLLYFPVVAEMRRGGGWRRPGIWLWPVALLTLVTVGLYLGHAVLGADYGGSGTVGPFQGAVALDYAGTFRAFLIDDVLFLPAFAFLSADVLSRGLTRFNAALAVLLLSAMFLAHTRGLWVGASATAAVVLLGHWPRARLVSLRRLVLLAAALIAAGALVISADPPVGRSIQSAFTGSNELSTAVRVAQAPQLLHGFDRHPFLGSGLGATLPSGYARLESAPWTFELTYLQLLFELGVIGTALVLLPMIMALWRAWRAVMGTVGPGRVRGLAGLGAATGLALACAGNQYLLTSVGMLALAVVLALVETASPGSVAAAAPAPSAASSADNTSGWRRAPRVALRPAPAFGAILAAVALLTLTEFRRTRIQATARQAGGGIPVRYLALPNLPRGRTFVVANGNQDAAARVWIISAQADRLVARPLTFLRRAGDKPDSLVSIGPLPRGTLEAVQVNAWHGSDAAFLLSQTGAQIRIEVRSLDGGQRVLARMMTSVGAAPRGGTRDLRIGIGADRVPRLFVIDRQRRATIRIFSAASRFSRPLASVGVPNGDLARGNWDPIAGSVNSAASDIAFVSSSPPTSHNTPEIHVFLVQDPLPALGEQRTLPGPFSRDSVHVGIVHFRGAPLLVTLVPSLRQLAIVAL